MPSRSRFLVVSRRSLALQALVLCVSALTVAACGSSNAGSGVQPTVVQSSALVQGTVGGQPAPQTDALSEVGTQENGYAGSNGPGLVTYLDVTITSISNACASEQAGHNPPSTRTISLRVAVAGAYLSLATYPIGDSSAGTATASFTATDSKCSAGTVELAANGSITLVAASLDAVRGTFDLTMEGGDHIHGSFDAPLCDVGVSSGATPACGS